MVSLLFTNNVDGTSTHFIALFAQWGCGDDVKCPLLAFSPLLDESDYSAASHHEFIEYHLAVFGKSLENVVCLVGDNMSTNRALADVCGVPLVGCAAHKFNLEMQDFLEAHAKILDRLHSLMTKLRTLKNSALLRAAGTNIRPKLRCATRWTGTFGMIECYYKIKAEIVEVSLQTDEILALLLTPIEERDLLSLWESLEPLKSVMVTLQTPNLNMLESRVLFDEVIRHYPTMNKRLAVDAMIVHTPSFDSGVVKLLRGIHLYLYLFIFTYIIYIYLYLLDCWTD